MTSIAEREEPRRNAHLLASLALAVAFVVASWSSLSLPFSTGEAGFVHEALRASGQATSPDFETDSNPVPARILTVIQQLVGPSERSLRLAFILLLVLAACVFAELIPVAALASAVTPLLAILALQFHGRSTLIRSGILAVLPASLALLGAPLGRRITNARAILGLAGMLALGALSLEAAGATAAVLLGVAVVRGSILERLTAVVTGAAGVAMGWVVHGPPLNPPSLRPALPDVTGWIYAIKDTWPRLAAAAIVLVSLLVDDGWRRHRLGLLLGSVLAMLVVGSFEHGRVTRDGLLAAAATESVLVLLLAVAANALGLLVRVPLALALLIALALQFRYAPPPARTALDVLDQARAVAQPGSALAISGPDRVTVAVYVRLGHAPAMPLIYMPENASQEKLAALCRANHISLLWLHPPRAAAPPGFAAPESRPAAPPALMPLAVSGQ